MQTLRSLADSIYRQYRCPTGDPLSCEHAHKTVQQNPDAKHCLTCNFPSMLASEAQIRGTHAIYQIEQCLGRRGYGRLYQGYRLPDEQPVVIKEYLLPTRTFNQEETRQRKQAFSRLVGLSLADGRSQDFRLLIPSEAIVDQREERCYVVTPGMTNAAPALRQQLAANGAMGSWQVRKVLAQALQTLEFLNRQKFRFPNGVVKQGIAHGNLSLDTVLIRTPESTPAAWHEDFLIYLCDLGIWEQLFAPPTLATPEPTFLDDLEALGGIGYYLLVGGTVDPASGDALDPRTTQPFPPASPALKDYLLRLLRIGVPFDSVEAARQALLQLPPEPAALNPVLPLGLERAERVNKPTFGWWKWLLIALLIGLGGFLLWKLIAALLPDPQVSRDQPLCCINQVSGIPEGTFTYTAEQDGTWSYVLLQRNLVEHGKNLDMILQEQQPELKLNYQPQPSTTEAIERVRSSKADFMITSLLDQVNADLGYSQFAYDGLAVFVSFSYAQRNNSLPRFLQGRITFDQLRQLYTGEIANWRELGGPNLPVKLYIPSEQEAVAIFEQRVLKDPQSIARFRSLQGRMITQLPTFPTLRRVIRDFEQDGIGAIAFGTLSKVFGQCSVYPLALVDGGQAPVQALLEANGQAISPETNLCGAKGSYDRNIAVFQTQRYPLGYSLAVVYPRDNRRLQVGQKFAEILQTAEGQRLLSRTGLIPLSPLSTTMRERR
ncbi:substrate-binding domain-containing protein [Pantanalinema rosaneae CENA516]|uniref:substrate-binding domain-containing protein n=1 Tax=Pantanalinema rosaneae TaxID=1620701 RepID=UPI003D6E8BB4